MKFEISPETQTTPRWRSRISRADDDEEGHREDGAARSRAAPAGSESSAGTGSSDGNYAAAQRGQSAVATSRFVQDIISAPRSIAVIQRSRNRHTDRRREAPTERRNCLIALKFRRRRIGHRSIFPMRCGT